MRFLSFSQPWLWAVLDEVADKGIENRSWQPPISMIGQRIALHAAKSWDDAAIPFFIKLGIEHPARRELYPTGAIVGVATIDRIVTTPKMLAADQARWFFGEFGWVLTERITLLEPIPMKGAQGLRHLPPEVEGPLQAQLAELGPNVVSGNGIEQSFRAGRIRVDVDEHTTTFGGRFLTPIQDERSIAPGAGIRFVHVMSKPSGGEMRGYALVDGALRVTGANPLHWPEMDKAVARRTGARLHGATP